MSWLNGILYAYGAINVVGGVIGAVRGSVWSLVVGGIAGLAVLWLTRQTISKPAFAYRSLGMITLGLTAFWIYRLVDVMNAGKSPMQAIMLLTLSAFVFACLGYAHFAAQKKRTDQPI